MSAEIISSSVLNSICTDRISPDASIELRRILIYIDAFTSIELFPCSVHSVFLTVPEEVFANVAIMRWRYVSSFASIKVYLLTYIRWTLQFFTLSFFFIAATEWIVEAVKPFLAVCQSSMLGSVLLTCSPLYKSPRKPFNNIHWFYLLHRPDAFLLRAALVHITSVFVDLIASFNWDLYKSFSWDLCLTLAQQIKSHLCRDWYRS